MSPEQIAAKGTEHAHQAALFAWANMAANHGIVAANDMNSYKSREWVMANYGTHKRVECLATMFAIPNGGERHAAVAAKLKAEGVKKGVSDIMLPYPTGKHHGLFIELKKLDSRGATPEQEEFCLSMNRLGYAAHVAHGWSMASGVIIGYLWGMHPNCC